MLCPDRRLLRARRRIRFDFESSQTQRYRVFRSLDLRLHAPGECGTTRRGGFPGNKHHRSIESILKARAFSSGTSEFNTLPDNLIYEIQYSANRGEYLLATENIDLPSYGLIQNAIAVEHAAGGKPGTAQAYLNQTVSNPLAGKVPGTLGAATITTESASNLFPQFSGVTVLRRDRDSDYQSLQATLQRRLGLNLNLLFAYTFGKILDNAQESNYNSADQPNFGNWQNPYDLRDARGPSTLDHTNVFAGSAVYSLPFGQGQRYLTTGWGSKLAGGFQLNGILTGEGGIPRQFCRAHRTAWGSAVGGPTRSPIRRSRAPETRMAACNGSAPLPIRLSTAASGTAPIRDGRVRGPQYWDLDMGLQRTFHIYERLNLQLRAEAFNALNHPNLTLPIQDASSPSFGQINSVYAARAFQFDGQLHF